MLGATEPHIPLSTARENIMQSNVHRALAAMLVSALLTLCGPALAQDATQDAHEAIRKAGEAVGQAIKDAAREMRKTADETKRELKAALEEARSFTETEEVKATIVAWTQALVDKKHGTWIAYWSEDAQLFPPGHVTLKGRDQILTYADKFPPAADFTFSDWRVEGRGDLAVVTNHLRWGETHFKQMIALRREGEDWKIQLVMYNSGVAE